MGRQWNDRRVLQKGFQFLGAGLDLVNNRVVRTRCLAKILVSIIDELLLLLDLLTDLQQGGVPLARFTDLPLDGGDAIQQWEHIYFLPLEIHQRLALHRSGRTILVLVGELVDLPAEARNRVSLLLCLRLKEPKLLAVIEPEHPVSSVADTSPVVLLMPGFAVLDLPLAGDGSISAPERLNGLDARVIEALS